MTTPTPPEITELTDLRRELRVQAELARLREQNSLLTNEVGKRQDDCALMTGQIQFLREQNRRLTELVRDGMFNMAGRKWTPNELAWQQRARATLAEGGKA